MSKVLAPTELVVGQTSLAGPSITFMTNAMRGIQEAAAKSGYCCEECKISSHSNRINVNLFMIFAADVKRSPLQTEEGRGLLIGITNGLMFTSGHMTPNTVDSIKNGLTVLGLNGSTTIPVVALPGCPKAFCFAPLFITDAFWFAIIPINNQFILVSCKNHLKRIWIKRGDKQIFMDSPPHGEVMQFKLEDRDTVAFGSTSNGTSMQFSIETTYEAPVTYV